ncbi:MAG: TIGR03915 family putative DNA repair protein [Prevotellaceae bacterium]|jgi:probable DNA metabolism protein|nr:TIGR03915 family putative DNA repair protein [Prevotellaceae bacterium]
MNALFRFDSTFDGLLTAVFDAYSRRTFPDLLLPEGEPLPLFHGEPHTVVTDPVKAERVWKGLQQKLSPSALTCLMQCWLAEEPDTPMLLFRYIRKAINAPRSIETNFADADVLAFSRMWKRVDWERNRLMQFIRFQKAADGTYFAAVEPEKNALPLIVEHFRDRFADQTWLIYDIRRAYGYYYDKVEVREVSFEPTDRTRHLVTGRLDDAMMDKDERLFRQLWQSYFKAVCIKERLNPRKHRQDMPVRYWKHLTEKQNQSVETEPTVGEG